MTLENVIHWPLGVIHVFAQVPWAAIMRDYVSPILVAVYCASLNGSAIASPVRR